METMERAMTDHIVDADKMPPETRRERRRRKRREVLEAIKELAVDVLVALVADLATRNNRKD